VYQGSGWETGLTPGYPNNLGHTMIYTAEEHDWLSKPAKKKRVSNQTADGSAPIEEDDRLWQRCWGIQTTIEVDGKKYTVPIQL